MVNETSPRARFTVLESERQPFLTRAQLNAELSLPYLIPPDGATGTTVYPTPNQSTGSRGVRSLSSKLQLSLFPPNSSFVRFTVSLGDVQIAALEEGTTVDEMAETVDSAFAKLEREFSRYLEVSAIRSKISEGFKHLIVGGNVLLKFIKVKRKSQVRVFSLSEYVVKRDTQGNLLEIITVEPTSYISLPRQVKESLVASEMIASPNPTKQEERNKEYKLYTYIRRDNDGDGFHSVQYIEDILVEGSESTYPADKLPYLALRMNSDDSSSYGRGLVEEFYGDLYSLDTLRRAINEGTASAAKTIWLVRPGGSTRRKKIADAVNNAVIEGAADDVSVLRNDKANDFRVASETAAVLKRDLEAAFLMGSSITRDAERVTAEEIRMLAQDVESNFGGFYSLLNQELLLPLVTILLSHMDEAPLLPNSVKPVIVTGLEALGRNNDLVKLQQGVKTAQELLGPERAAAALKEDVLMQRIFKSVGVEDDGLVKTPEERTQEQQQSQQQQALQSAVPNATKAVGDLVGQAANAPQEQPPN